MHLTLSSTFQPTSTTLTINDTLTAAQIDVTNLNINGVGVNGLQEATTEKKGIIRKAKTPMLSKALIQSAVTPAWLGWRVNCRNWKHRFIPTGVTVVMTAEASKPSGWLVCNGDTVPNGSGTIQPVDRDRRSCTHCLAAPMAQPANCLIFADVLLAAFSKDTGS